MGRPVAILARSPPSLPGGRGIRRQPPVHTRPSPAVVVEVGGRERNGSARGEPRPLRQWEPVAGDRDARRRTRSGGVGATEAALGARNLPSVGPRRSRRG